MHCFVPAFHKYSEEQNADVGPMKVLQQMTFYNIAYLLCARHFSPCSFIQGNVLFSFWFVAVIKTYSWERVLC